MRKPRYAFTAFAVPLALAAFMLPGMGTDIVYAQAKGMGAPPSKVEITIHDRQHGYETVGLTMPSHDTVIVIHNKDSVTHGFASNLFKGSRFASKAGLRSRGKTSSPTMSMRVRR